MTVTLKDRVAQALEAGFTKAELARAAGVTTGAVSQWGEKVKGLKAPTARGLAKLTGWRAEWWETGEGSRNEDPPPPMPSQVAAPWPFEEVTEAQILSLSPKQLAKVDLRLKDALKEVLGEFSPTKAASNH